MFSFQVAYPGRASLVVTILHIVTGERRPQLDIQTNPFSMFRQAFPGGAHNRPQVLVANAYHEAKEHLIDFMSFELLRVEGFGNDNNSHLIAGQSVAQTLRSLEAHGLQRDLLPRCLGGRYDYNQYDDFIRTRLSIEDIMSAAPISPNVIALKPPPAQDSLSIAPHQNAAATAATNPAVATAAPPAVAAENVAQNQIDRVRKRKAIHARHFRAQKKMEVQSLESERAMYLKQNENLRKANRQLESVLVRARLIVATLNASSMDGAIDLTACTNT